MDNKNVIITELSEFSTISRYLPENPLSGTCLNIKMNYKKGPVCTSL